MGERMDGWGIEEGWGVCVVGWSCEREGLPTGGCESRGEVGVGVREAMDGWCDSGCDDWCDSGCDG